MEPALCPQRAVCPQPPPPAPRSPAGAADARVQPPAEEETCSAGRARRDPARAAAMTEPCGTPSVSALPSRERMLRQAAVLSANTNVHYQRLQNSVCQSVGGHILGSSPTTLQESKQVSVNVLIDSSCKTAKSTNPQIDLNCTRNTSKKAYRKAVCGEVYTNTSRRVFGRMCWLLPFKTQLLLFLVVAAMWATPASAAAATAAGDGALAKGAAKVVAAAVTETQRRPARAPAPAPDPTPAGGAPPRLELSTEFFLVPDRLPAAPHPAVVVTRSPSAGEAGAPGGVALLPAGGGAGAGNRSLLLRPGLRAYAGGASAGAGLLRREAWVIPLLVFSALCMVVIAGFEVFVLCKARRTTPSRRHLFLGQMLLLGLFLCAGVGGVLAATPTPATCGAVRFGAGVAFALVFAALLVKCVFLISLNGGVYLPAPYQALLLLFAVLIQVAVGLQWLLNAPPQVDFLPLEETLPPRRQVLTADDLLPQPICRAPYTDVLLSLLYVACLIVFVAVLAIKSRGIRDNYREATFIGLAVGCVVPIWLVWVLSGLLVAERHRDACLAFGLVATATVVFLVMFMPKGRQLAAMGKEGVYVEDREERFSTLSRAGSGYSPSFYHFKPIKYSAAPLAAPPPAPMTAASHKQSVPAVTTIADRVALVAAPSYTRMYHYYPYCYYPGGVYVKPDDGNVYTTLEPTLSSNPNVFFQRSGVHPGMMY